MFDQKSRDTLKKHLTPKNIGRFVVKNSVRFVVTTGLASLVEPESKTEKVKLYVGSYVIAELVANEAGQYFDTKFDTVQKCIEEAKEENAETSETTNPDQ